MAWLDEVPAHWSVSALRWLSTRYTGGTPDRENAEFWSEGSIPWLNSGAVNDPVIHSPSAYISERGFAGSSAKWIPQGALVMALAGQGKTKGTVAQLGFSATCNQSMAALIPTERVEARYLFWWLRSNYANIRSLSGGDLRDGLNLQMLGGIPVPLPSTNEQRAIVDFIDRETAQIDELIGRQERLIELLTEKRQAIITHAVTKGLDPTAPTKPSGIPWLGEVPTSWSISTIKREWTVIDCKHLTAEFVDDGVPLASIREVQGKFVNLDTAKYTTMAFYRSMIEGNRQPRPGDLIFSRNATVGEVAIVPYTHEPFAMGQDVCMLKRRTNQTSPEFGWYAIRSRYVQQQIVLAMIGSTFKRINVEDIRSLNYFAPPPAEQRAIAMYLDERSGAFDKAVAAAGSAIELLRERRSALISAAVTGKIDVREGATQL
jgi:type I restriction enzyme S subunit